MKFLHILFGEYRLVSKNDLNALYAKSHAAFSRLEKIEVNKLRYKVEKDQVLSILNEAKQIASRLT